MVSGEIVNAGDFFEYGGSHKEVGQGPCLWFDRAKFGGIIELVCTHQINLFL